ncbi:MAG: chloride channel protein [Anaerolineae bacterium]|nr:chloride channel protein [Anaerolineae bacterium]
MVQVKEDIASTTRLSLLQVVPHTLSKILGRLQLSEEAILVITSLLVGLGTGIGAVIFNRLIEAISWVSFTWIPQALSTFGQWYIVLVPALGGLLAGPLIYRYAREAKGHGVPEVMQAIALQGGRIRPVVVVIKAIASSLTIGTGGSVGREGPIVQIGAAFGSTLGQAMRLSDDRLRNLVACGAAGGIAATFNAPIAGVIFALEVILGELSVGYVSTIVICAVTASTVTQAFLGVEYAFPTPEFTIVSVWEFAFYIVLALCATFVSVAFVRLLYWLEDVFADQKLIPEWFQPAIGGLLLGLLALIYPLVLPFLGYNRLPQVFGGGYQPIADALASQGILIAVLALLVLKLLATILTLGSGGSGGIFAPSLFMGAMLGEAIGIIVNAVFPGLVAPPGAYALVGMAAVFSGAAHAPVTAILIVFEMTGDYRIILPLMLTVVTTTLLSHRLLGGSSIYTLKLKRRGIQLQSGRDVDILQSVTIGEVMDRDVDTVPVDMALAELAKIFNHTRRHGFPVLDSEGKLWGIITVTDVDRAAEENLPQDTKLEAIGTPRSQLVVAFPDEPIGQALTKMGPRGLGRLPVASREDPNRLVGLVRRIDIIQAYNMALARRTTLRYQAQRLQRQSPGDTQFIDFTLNEPDQAIGKALRDLATDMPDDCILISIQRKGKVIIPHGDTILESGDQITAFVRSRDVHTLTAYLRGTNDPRSAD